MRGGYQSGRKVVPQDSKSDLPLALLCNNLHSIYIFVVVQQAEANVHKGIQ